MTPESPQPITSERGPSAWFLFALLQIFVAANFCSVILIPRMAAMCRGTYGRRPLPPLTILVFNSRLLWTFLTLIYLILGVVFIAVPSIRSRRPALFILALIAWFQISFVALGLSLPLIDAHIPPFA